MAIRISSEDSDLKELFGHNGVWLTAGIIVADVVGAGILAMPVAVANLGLIPGIITLVVLLLANVHISIAMWRVRMFCPTCADTTTYSAFRLTGVRVWLSEAFVRGAFAKAPAWQRHACLGLEVKRGFWLRMIGLTGFCQKSFMIGMLVLYLLSAGKGFGGTAAGLSVMCV